MADERVLVADDEPEIIDLCSRLLVGEGYTVQAAMSGQEAIACLEAGPCDLLVIDIKMPDMDGLTVLRRGRELSPDLAAVVITGFATMDIALEALHSGARGFVLKPFDLQEFIQVTAEALEQKRKERERLRLRAQLPILEIAQALLAESDLDRMAGQLLETVGRELAAEQALLALLDRQTDELAVAGAIGLSAAGMDALPALRLPVGQGIVGQAAWRDKPVLLDGSAGLEPSLQVLLGLPDARIMLVPLRTRKEPVGVLILSRTASSKPFTAGDLDLMSIMSTQIGIALENARLFRETGRLRKFNESIVQSVAEAIVIENAEGIIAFVNPAMEALVGYDRRELVGRHWSAIIPPDETEHAHEQALPGIPQAAGRYERTLLGKSGLIIPVILNARPLFEGERFIGTLSAITDIAELRQAEDRLRRRNVEMAALNAVAAATSQSLDLEEILDAALGQTLEALEAEGGLIYLFDEASQSFAPAAHRGIPQDVLREVTGFKMGVGLSGQVAESGEALVIADLGSDPRNISPTAARLGWHSYAGVPIKSKGKPLGVMTLVTGQVGHFKPDHVGLLSHIGSQVGVAIENAWLYQAAQQEITERKRAEEALQQRNRELELLNRTGRAFNSTLDLEQVLITILEEVRHLLDVTACSIWILDPETGQLVCWQAAGPHSERVRGWRLDRGEGFVGWVADHGESLIVPDTWADTRYFRAVGETAGLGLRSILSIPLRSKQAMIGVLQIVDSRVGRFGAGDLKLLEPLAASAVIAIENARLFEEVRAARDRLQLLSRRLVEVQEAERRHIARELHDEVGQVLTGLKLTLEMGASLPPEEFQANLEEAQTLVNQLMAEVRNLSLDLRPAMLDDLGLLPALLWHFERYTAQTQVHVAFRQIGLERRFQPEIETVVYRIIQEALTNVARHAGVDNVTVRVWADEETLNLQVEDQGTGFDPEAALAASVSSGLSGMYERVGLLDGQLSIESIAGAGTALTARLPLSGLGEKEEAEP